ncbi:hypothetical protein WDU94_014634 [Cyamophila willieti]
MPEFSLTLNTKDESDNASGSMATVDECRSQPKARKCKHNVSGSMATVDECRSQPNARKCKDKKKYLKKETRKTNLKKSRTKLKTALRSAKRMVTKRKSNKPKKLNKKDFKGDTPNLLKRRVPLIPCRTVCDPNDLCNLVLDCDSCNEYSVRNITPRSNYTGAARCSKLRARSSDKDINELNLLINLLASAENGRRDPAIDGTENKTENLGRSFPCNLNKRIDCCKSLNLCYPDPCNHCCSHMCPPATCGDQPTNILRNSFIHNFQERFCEQPKTSYCGMLCPACIKSSKCFLPCNNVFCQGNCACACACVKKSPERCLYSCSLCSSKSPERKILKRSVRNKDLKFKSRTWLLENNEKLERELASLRRQQRSTTCVCYEHIDEPNEQVSRGHASFLLWEFLMQSMVNTLVESHPALRE